MSKPDTIDHYRDSVVPHDMDLFQMQFENGMAVGESTGIKEIDHIYSEMPGFLYCHTGWPNSGKSKITLFTKLVQGIHFKKRFIIVPPEEITSVKVDGKIIRSAGNIYNELVHMLTGKVPYKHWKQKYNRDQMTLDEYVSAHETVRKYCIVIDPKDKHYKNIKDTLLWAHEEYGTHSVVIDPWKNLKLDDTGRGDRDLDYAFHEFKEFALDTQQSVHFIAHGKSDKAPKNSDGSYKICDQFGLLGGASWYNNMDVMISWYRPFGHKLFTDPNYSLLTMINLKQRDEHLTNRKGQYDEIEFDFFKNRYYFDGRCPIDGELLKPSQGTIPYGNTWQATNNHIKEEEAPF